MSEIVAKTVPNAEGEMLWCVHYRSSYYDNDERMPGTVPIDSRSYVLAKGREEAITKAEVQISRARKQRGKGASEEIEATIVTLENLVPARQSSNDGRMGWVSTDKLTTVELSCPEDANRYRLAVCLVPVK